MPRLNARLLLRALEDRITPSIAEFIDPHPAPGNYFGSTVLPLSTGNVVITSPLDDAGGTDAGAVYLFNGKTGALISTLTGSQTSDYVGSGGVAAVGNGNYVIISYNWRNGAVSSAGAFTFGNGVTGISGSVSAVNSLVGRTKSDFGGNMYESYAYVEVLANGNYLVVSPNWDNIGAGGVAVNAGAVTFGNGATGVSGPISSAISLVGTATGDRLARSGVTLLTNGNYVVNSPYWYDEYMGLSGAVTFGNAMTGVQGEVTEFNSYVGDGASIGTAFKGVVALSNGNYVVSSPDYLGYRGAVTWGNGTTGSFGRIGESNSLFGTSPFDRVGWGVLPLTNGNYVVFSSEWDNGTIIDAGAVTFASGVNGITGPVTTSNSLVGHTASDFVGRGEAVALTNGNYVVCSPYWHLGSAANVGAATFGNGTTGVVGEVTASNSLTGSQQDDYVGGSAVNAGYGGVTALSTGNYVIRSPIWNNGLITKAGAVTFCNGLTGLIGAVGPGNSLVGTTAGDAIGDDPGANVAPEGVTPLPNGDYVVRSPRWDNGLVVNAGAATLGSGVTGITGPVSSMNSLVGTTMGDFGANIRVTPLSNGNYVISLPFWDNGSIMDAGAVVLAHGLVGITGPVSSANSVVGTHTSDYVGRPSEQDGKSVVALTNGNYVVNSYLWDNGAITDAGAITLGDGVAGVTGPVTDANSFVGSQSGAIFGYGYVTRLGNGNFVLTDPIVNNGAGAFTFANGATDPTGMYIRANSVFGNTPTTYISIGRAVIDDVNRIFCCPFPVDGGGRVRVGSQIYGFVPAKIGSISINGGAAQRSRVTSVAVTFDQIVDLPAVPSTAFRLTRQNDGAIPALSATVNNSGSGTVVTLTFTGTTSVDFGSLADGRYTLSVFASQVNAGNFDGNGDGLYGDNYSLVGSPGTTLNLFRFYGDSDGNGSVAVNDFIAFRFSLGLASNIFDFDDDGFVTASDFIQFRLRFGGSI